MTPTPEPGPATTPRAARRAGKGPRRGSIYAVVLGMALLVSLIGLSAVAVGRVNLRAAAIGSDGADAELLALSAIEHAAATINTDPGWRSNYTNDSELNPPLSLGHGTFTWKLVDETDASLVDGGVQPVRVWGIGRVGEARRYYSVQFTPGGTNLLTNPGTESGITGYEAQNSDCTLESAADEPRNGARYIWVRSRTSPAAGPQQALTGLSSGTSYYVELWVKMTQTAEAPWLSFVIKQAAGNTVYKVRGHQPARTEWTRVGGTLTPSWGGTADAIYFRVETNSTNQDFKIDDLRVVAGSPSTMMIPAADSWRQESLP